MPVKKRKIGNYKNFNLINGKFMLLLLLFFILGLTFRTLAASDENLVAYWSMDEIRNGVIEDKSGNGNDAKVVGDLSLAESPNGKAALFDGSGKSYLVVEPGRTLEGLTDFTIEFMVNYRNLFALEKKGNNYPTIINRGNYQKEYPSFWLFTGFHASNKVTSGRLCDWFKKKDWPDVKFTASAALTWEKNRWYHIKTVVDSEKKIMKYYRDGEAVGESEIQPDYGFGSGNIYIGSYQGNKNSGMMDGLIDEIKICDNALEKITASTSSASMIEPGTVLADGELAESAWQNAAKENFVATGKGSLPRKPGTVSFLYDKDNLYIGIKFTEPQPESVKAIYKKHDEALWQDDSAEIFIGDGKDPKCYYHLIFNSNGTRFDEKVLSSLDSLRNWDPEWHVKVKNGEGFWSAEAVIPFKSLGIEKSPASGSTVRISVNREEQNIPEFSGWPNGEFHKPEKFGTLIFDTYKNALTYKIANQKKLQADIFDQTGKISDPSLTAKAKLVLEKTQNSLESMEKELERTSGDISSKEWYYLNKELDLINKKLLITKFEVKGMVLLHDLTSVKIVGENERQYFQKEMLELDKECGKTVASSPEVREMDKKLRSQYWQKLFNKPYLCWEKSPWTNLLPTQFPNISGKECSKLNMIMGRNEYEQTAFAITNFTDRDMKVRVEISGSDKLKVTVREGYIVKVENGELVNDSLPLLETMTIPPLQSREIWVMADSTQAESGDYAIKLKVAPENMPSTDIGVNIKVYPLTFPKTPQNIPLNSFVCDYVNCFDAEFSNAAKKDLLSHHINVPYITCGYLPLPVFKKDGTMEVDYSKLDKSLDFWEKDFKIIGLYWALARHGFADMRARFGTEKEYMTEPWKKRFSMWYKQLLEHFAEKGLGYDDFFFHTFDETTKPDVKEFFAYLKELDPNVKLFLNPCGATVHSTSEIKACAPFVDIWCPWFNTFSKRTEDLDTMKRNTDRNGFWFYYNPSIRIYRLASPYGSYRLCGWKSWINGASGCGMWAYCISGAAKEQWNEYEAKEVAWDMIYLSATAPADVTRKELIIPSKRWEGFREGIEDYTYLAMLRDAVHNFKPGNEKETRHLRYAKEVLEKWPAEVCRQHYDDAIADKAKQEIFDALCPLKGMK